jgi:hypothetical protein
VSLHAPCPASRTPPTLPNLGTGGRGGPGPTRRPSRCRIPATAHASPRLASPRLEGQGCILFCPAAGTTRRRSVGRDSELAGVAAVPDGPDQRHVIAHRPAVGTIISLSGQDADSRVVRTALTLARVFDAVLYAIDVQESPPRSPPGVQGSAPRMRDASPCLS